MSRVDLYLGGPIGLWALRSVEPASVRRVFTLSDEIARTARDLGIEIEQNGRRFELRLNPLESDAP